MVGILFCSKLSFLLGWLAALQKNNLRHLEQEIYKRIFLIVRNVTTLQHGCEKRCETDCSEDQTCNLACWVMTDRLAYLCKWVTDIIEWLEIFLRQKREGQLTLAASLWGKFIKILPPPGRVKFWHSTWPWNSDIKKTAEMATKQ